MRALGLYAVDPDAGEILYAVTRETSGNCYSWQFIAVNYAVTIAVIFFPAIVTFVPKLAGLI